MRTVKSPSSGPHWDRNIMSTWWKGQTVTKMGQNRCVLYKKCPFSVISVSEKFNCRNKFLSYNKIILLSEKIFQKIMTLSSHCKMSWIFYLWRKCNRYSFLLMSIDSTSTTNLKSIWIYYLVHKVFFKKILTLF